MGLRRITWLLAVLLVIGGLLAGCGDKDASSIVKDLDRKMNKVESYQGSGRMVVHTGVDPQEYQVEVWYKAPSYYRISLTNEKKDISQIVLRNDEGVFVLTPHLNKSFRFQSDWPQNQGQVYLYQSLVQSIVADRERQFTTDGDTYVFDVAGNYQNASFARQRVWLTKKDFAPKHIEVENETGQKLLEFDFTAFQFGQTFDKDSFDMKRNMSSEASPNAQSTLGATDKTSTGNAATDKAAGEKTTADKAASAKATTDKATAEKAAADKATADKAATGKASQAFGVIEPTYLPKGVMHQGISDIQLGESKGVLLRFSGKYNYTLVESKSIDQAVASMKGTMVDLGYTYALLSGDTHKTMIWTYDGIEYRLTSADLLLPEMIKIAQSTQGQVGK